PARTPTVPDRDRGRAGPYATSATPRSGACPTPSRRPATAPAGATAARGSARTGATHGSNDDSLRLPPERTQPRASRTRVARDLLFGRGDDPTGQFQPRALGSPRVHEAAHPAGRARLGCAAKRMLDA